MNIKKFKKKLNNIKDEFDRNINPLEKRAKEFIGLKVRIEKGEYAGRWGEITYVKINNFNGMVHAIIAPYRIKKGRGNSKLLNSRNDARLFWPLNDIKKIRLKKE